MTPLYTDGLFAPLQRELVALLRSLTPDDWMRPTVAGRWRVRDVAAHLVDIDLRKLSMGRDGHAPTPSEPIGNYADLVRFLNRLNSDWIEAAQRLSPALLVDLLAFTGPLVAELVEQLPPHQPAPYAVSWAGEETSEHWFDIGRDYTERWHHQMQIRDAVAAPLLLERAWLQPLLDISMRVLPHVYRNQSAPPGTAMVVRVAGAAGGAWTLVREAAGWRLYRGAADRPTTVVTLEPDTAWRVFYNALPRTQLPRQLTIEGDASLAEPLLSARSVMV